MLLPFNRVSTPTSLVFAYVPLCGPSRPVLEFERNQDPSWTMPPHILGKFFVLRMINAVQIPRIHHSFLLG